MSHHIVHLLSPHLRVRMRLDQLHILDREKDLEKSIPLRDIAVIICAAPDASFTAASLRRAAELGVLVLICDEKFQPACLTIPYYQATTSDLPRRQATWPKQWKAEQWRTVITAKVMNQAALLEGVSPKTAEVLQEIARKCAKEPVAADGPAYRPGKMLASVTANQRDALRSWSPPACESRAARLYWGKLLPVLDPGERTRQGGTRRGINGMLDYGYAIVRTAVLRSLAAHGFIAALGIQHTTKPGGQPLADDLMEPLRPFSDRALLEFLTSDRTWPDSHAERMKLWIPHASAVLTQTICIRGANIRLLNAVDLYVQSLAKACQGPHPLAVPLLPTP